MGAGSRPFGYIDQTVGSSTRGGSSSRTSASPNSDTSLAMGKRAQPAPAAGSASVPAVWRSPGPPTKTTASSPSRDASLVDDGARVHRGQRGARVDGEREQRTRRGRRGPPPSLRCRPRRDACGGSSSTSSHASLTHPSVVLRLARYASAVCAPPSALAATRVPIRPLATMRSPSPGEAGPVDGAGAVRTERDVARGRALKPQPPGHDPFGRLARGGRRNRSRGREWTRGERDDVRTTVVILNDVDAFPADDEPGGRADRELDRAAHGVARPRGGIGRPRRGRRGTGVDSRARRARRDGRCRDGRCRRRRSRGALRPIPRGPPWPARFGRKRPGRLPFRAQRRGGGRASR